MKALVKTTCQRPANAGDTGKDARRAGKITGEIIALAPEITPSGRDFKEVSRETNPKTRRGEKITPEMKTISRQIEKISPEMKKISREMEMISGEMKKISGETKPSLERSKKSLER
jgi:predicted  nucleic acid-binding Zn-ribbon protein